MIFFDDRRMGWPYAILNIDQPFETVGLPLPDYTARVLVTEEEQKERSDKDAQENHDMSVALRAETEKEDIRSRNTKSEYYPGHPEVLDAVTRALQKSTVRSRVIIGLREVHHTFFPNDLPFGERHYLDTFIQIFNYLVGNSPKAINPIARGWHLVMQNGEQRIAWRDMDSWGLPFRPDTVFDDLDDLDMHKRRMLPQPQVQWIRLLTQEEEGRLLPKPKKAKEKKSARPISLDDVRQACVRYFEELGPEFRRAVIAHLTEMGYGSMRELKEEELAPFMKYVENTAAHMRKLRENADDDDL